MPSARQLDPVCPGPRVADGRPRAEARHGAAHPASGWIRAITGWRAEVGLFVLAYLVYQATRVLIRGDADDALSHARWVFDMQRRMGLGLERSVQGALLGTPWLEILDWVYLGAQTVVLAGGLVLVYRTSPRVYRTLRTTLLATWTLALPVSALFPTAPPRLAGIGLVDSVTADTPFGLAGGGTTLLFNPYAAVPSLHAGFAVALGLAVAVTARRRAVRLAGLAWGPLVILAVLATGNHFAFDIAAGLALTGAGLALALLIDRLRTAPPGAVVPRRPRAR